VEPLEEIQSMEGRIRRGGREWKGWRERGGALEGRWTAKKEKES